MPAINAREFYNFLSQNNTNYIYHANTVTTACTFMYIGGLLSRTGVDNRGLWQTPQYTDKLDRRYNIYGDIFFDGSDIHYRTRRKAAYNKYGPVLFKFGIEVLLMPNLPELWITKQNPCNWDNILNENEKYFNTINEIEEYYDNYDFGHHITLKSVDFILPFEGYLSEIILDDPQVYYQNQYVFDISKNALIESARNGGMVNPDLPNLVRRRCNYCNCINTYTNMKESEFSRLFFPNM